MNKKIRILIVEDEIMIAEDVSLRLINLGYIVIDNVSNAEKAIRILQTQPIDLLLIDINLQGDTNGIDLAERINADFQLPFIFLTSLANQNIIEQAKKVHPSAYLLKPFNDRQVQISIEMALANYQKFQSDTKIHPQPKATTSALVSLENCLFLRKDDHYTRVNFNNILWLKAENNYTLIHTDLGEFFYSTVLKKFEEKLPSNLFVRVHRSYIINLTKVEGFEGNRIIINRKSIPVTKSRRDWVFKLFHLV